VGSLTRDAAHTGNGAAVGSARRARGDPVVSTLTNPTSSAVMSALRQEQSGAAAVSRTLAFTLILDGLSHSAKQLAEFEAIAVEAAASHPCRLIVLSRDAGRGDSPSTPLEVEVSGPSPSCPTELLRVSVPFVDAERIEAVLRGLLANDVPVVCWWPFGTPSALQLEIMSKFVQRRVFDSGSGDDPLLALQTIRSEYRPGDSDLAWARISALRGLVTSALDWRGGTIRTAQVRLSGVASALLLGNWLERLTAARVDYAEKGDDGVVLELGCTDPDGEDYRLVLTEDSGRYFTVAMDDNPPLRHVGPAVTPALLLATELSHLGEDAMYKHVLSALTI
jgi:glucose-6-phosphate dehydrogenase assembly protein OpcA